MKFDPDPVLTWKDTEKLSNLSAKSLGRPLYYTILEGSMDTHRNGGSERLRTVWTPEMDRYFIDLMLEQVKKGNRFDDHLFSKRAWKSMSLSFTAKFKSPYGKDVLKNRHKTLRNMYKMVKILLEQDGFCWDERKQMVVADNDLWDEYLKVHPDVRSLRIKSVPYYRDLCLIYADGMSEQKGFSPHRCQGTTMASPEEETSTETLIQGGEGYRVCGSAAIDDSSHLVSNAKGTTRSRTSWHPPMDRYFIDLMLDQVRRGNQIEGVFRKQAWTEMVNSFNAKFESNYDVDVLKNRYKTLRRQYNAIKSLLQSDGFSWDDCRQMVTADDSLWQEYIKVHKDARQFMTRPIPYYKDLCLLCGEAGFDENDCLVAIDWFDPETELEEPKSHETSNGSQSQEPAISAEEGNISLLLDLKNKREQLDDGINPKNPKKQRRDELGTAGSSCTTIENAVMAVQALPDMDEDLILDACDLLEDEVKAKTFLALDAKLRKKWLLRKLRPQAT
ncbi:PREDICTED: L10-interacting MYB domain-containing protein isoform X2 [Tarenaya hassleriana]|uniref:L10-interacting MYB domain-containing protein isoform X2 n=1 Tax=Tarenaya hassleriana TaxID=28532 RepID=UPI00053C1C40|nr:PREDICTED: L10-interacting MYB domain-containing protein isoform X2 [Tarenaya hassleriana]